MILKMEQVHLLECIFISRAKTSVNQDQLAALVTCVALGKAGLVVGPLHLSIYPFIRSSVRLSVRLSVSNTFKVSSLCNLKLQQ